MANNRLLFFEPNKPDREIPNTEDLSIFVELKAITRGRSVITGNAEEEDRNRIESSDGPSKTIGFLDGTKVGIGRRSLTTNYTEISTNFSPNGENDLESLGIESIDISFDTAYTPIIKIKFIDIRGNAVLEQGTSSKYKMFFELPFPMFELTIKGFYGKPVTYCLHLTKWNASFNSGTGNFEINTDFIGYTYALLTDCLLGYMRATVYTNIGSDIFKKYQNMLNEDNSPKYPNLTTIDDFLDYISTINDEFSKIKESDENIKQINSLTSLSKDISKLDSKLTRLKRNIGKSDIFEGKLSTRVLLSKNDVDIEGDKKSPDKLISEFKELNNKDIEGDDGINQYIEIEDLKININELNNIIKTQLTRNNFIDSEELSNEFKSIEQYDSSYINNLSNTLINAYPDSEPYNNSFVYLFDFQKPYDEISRLNKLINERKEQLNKNLTNELKNKVDKLKFKPSIRNIVNMLSIHAQVFLETIREVSKIAENNAERKSILEERLTYNNIDVKKGDTIYPWPEYKREENGQIFESWIGSELKSDDFVNVEEVKFVEELLTQLMKIGKRDEKRLLTGFSNFADFYPVSPTEAQIRLNDKDSLITQNPYYKALSSNRSKATPQEAIRCLLYRVFTSLGVTNRISGTNYLPIIGKLEAENLYNLIDLEFDTIPKDEILNAINDIATGSSGKTESVISTWMNGGNIEGVTHPPKSDGKFFEEDGDVYKYKYITGDTLLKVDLGNDVFVERPVGYIPISGGFDGKDFFKGSGDTITFKTRDELKDLSNNLIFTSDYFGFPLSPKYDDGSLYFKILDNKEYFTGVSPAGSSKVMGKYIEDVGGNTILAQESLKSATYSNDKEIIYQDKINRYNGRYRTFEIDNLLYNGNESPENIHYRDETLPSGVGNVISAYYYEDYRGAGEIFVKDGGTFLSKKTESVNESTKERLDSFKINLSDSERFVNIYTTINHSKSGMVKKTWVTPDEFGNQKELIGELIKEGSDDIYLPFIDFAIGNDEDKPTHHFSLFGNLFYYNQTKEGKALLFLHSISWNGVIGEVKDSGISVDDVSLFDTEDTDGDSFEKEDETYTIKGLYGNNGSFIRAPRLWCAFIGGLLYRYDNREDGNEDIISFEKYDGKYVLPWQTDKTYTPKHDEYLHYNSNESECGIHFEMEVEDNDDDDHYGKVDRVILALPKQVREEFKRVFIDFTNGDFEKIQEKYELFSGPDDLIKKWDLLKDKVGLGKVEYENGRPTGNITYVKEDYEGNNAFTLPSKQRPQKTILKTSDIIDIIKNKDVLENYINVAPINNNDWEGSEIYQFDLKLTDNNNNTKTLVRLFSQTYYLMNATPRVFRINQENYSISVKQNEFKTVLQNFFIRFDELVEIHNDPDKDKNDEIQKRIFNNVDDDIIKLNIYRTLSAINNKWIGGDMNNKCGNIESIVDTFRFLDSAFLDIGDDFLINPLGLYNKIINNYNQSFFDLVNGLLIENNFNFISLPSFIDFTTVDHLKEDVFTPYSYNDSINKKSIGPAFICVYTGQQSSSLDLGEDSEYEDDGVYITNDGRGNQTGPEPDLFKSNGNESGFNVPYFLVSYARDNQSIFKDVKLDQREFTETAESLEIIDDLSQNGNKNKATYKGQNLFNIYQKRAYSAEIEMMGNATIQPMMYFQLNNIPMFRGAYLILSTSHNITAHNMKTTFKGTRIKNVKTPLITEAQLFQNLIGSLETAGEADTITDEELVNTNIETSFDTNKKAIIIS